MALRTPALLILALYSAIALAAPTSVYITDPTSEIGQELAKRFTSLGYHVETVGPGSPTAIRIDNGDPTHGLGVTTEGRSFTFHPGQNFVPADTAAELAYASIHSEAFTGHTDLDYKEVIRRMNSPSVKEGTATAKVLSPEGLELARSKLERIYERKYPHGFAAGGMGPISVNGKVLAQPKDVTDIVSALNAVSNAIHSSPVDPVKVSFGSKSFVIDRTPLGEGITGTVYSIVGEHHVLKIAKPSTVAVRTTFQEETTAQGLDELARSESFNTPRNLEFDPFGMFSVKEKVDGPKLTDVLLQKGLIHLERDADGQITAKLADDQALQRAFHDPVIQQIIPEVERLMELRKKHPAKISDIGPDNLILSFSDTAQTKLKGAYLVDIGPSGESTKAKFDAARGFRGYLDVSESLVNRYLATGVLDPSHEIPPHSSQAVCILKGVQELPH